MRWLRRFFSSGDPIVKLAAALSETEAEMRREVLANNGIPATVKNTDALSIAYYASTGNSYDLFVKQSPGARPRDTGPAAEVAPIGVL